MNDTFDSERERDLERLLRDEAAAVRRAPRPSVAARVVDALPERGGAAVTSSVAPIRRAAVPGPRPGALAGRLAVAATVVAGLYGLWTWDTVERSPVPPRTVEVAEAPRFVRLRLGDVGLTLSNPLMEEARGLGRDATRATGFLANRLPPTFRTALLSGL